MSKRNMNLDVIVRLRDLLSGPLRGIRGTLDGVTKAIRNIGIVGGAIAAISFMGPVQEAAAFQQKLLDIAGTQGLVGEAAFGAVSDMRRQFQDLAREVGMSSHDIGGAAGQMIAAGLDTKLVKDSIKDIARAATAANADIIDLAGVGTSLMQNLSLPANEIRSSLDGLVVAGKLGSFELKDMARYFPTLTGEVAKFGVTGREAVNTLGAALQVARKGTADPAEAANNLRNFLNKILAPTTVKSFAEAGVDIKAVMKDAAVQGINPIEAVVQKISKLTGASTKEIAGMMDKAKANGLSGAEALENVRKQLEAIHGAGKMGELFSDMQVTGFLIPMMANIEQYKQMKDEIGRATGSITDADFATQIKGMNRELQTFQELMRQIADEIGNAFGKWLPVINETIGKGLDMFREFDKQTGGMGSEILSFGGAAVIASVGIGALGFVLPVVAAGISALISPLRLLRPLFRGFGTASRGASELATSLDKVNAAAKTAQGIQRPSIWSMLFGGLNMANLVANIPDTPEGLQEFMDKNKKRSEGWNTWLDSNIGTPRKWLGLDAVDNAMPKVEVPKVDVGKVDELRKQLADITVKWPFAAQQDVRDFVNVLNAGGLDAAKKAGQIGDDIRDQLQISGNVAIETGEMENALKLARELSAAIRGIPSGVTLRQVVNDNLKLPANGGVQVPRSKMFDAAPKSAVLPAQPAAWAYPPRQQQEQAPVQLQGNVVIGLDPRLKIVSADSKTPGVNIGSGPNTGRAVGRV